MCRKISMLIRLRCRILMFNLEMCLLLMIIIQIKYRFTWGRANSAIPIVLVSAAQFIITREDWVRCHGKTEALEILRSSPHCHMEEGQPLPLLWLDCQNFLILGGATGLRLEIWNKLLIVFQLRTFSARVDMELFTRADWSMELRLRWRNFLTTCKDISYYHRSTLLMFSLIMFWHLWSTYGDTNTCVDVRHW